MPVDRTAFCYFLIYFIHSFLPSSFSQVPVDRTAFSNMPEVEVGRLPGGKLQRITFQETPIMSTYLLAFCVGEFDFIQGGYIHTQPIQHL